MATLAEGTIFAGRYRVLRCLASGGMGAVYEAVHLDTDRHRALKVMHPHLFQSDEMRERFKLEARIAAHVESEYIVDVSDAGVDEATKTPFMVMELLRGEELGDLLKRLGRLPPADVVLYMRQTAMALDRTHASAIIHRDLKPENLFLTFREDGAPRIKILDFGVAKVIAEGATAAGATRSLGTPLYMAPEQFRAGTRLTPAADIYALGMMTYTLLVGQAYWDHEARISGDVIAFAMAAVHGPQEAPTQRAAARGVTLPPAYDAWFLRATATNAAHRFQSASEAVQALAVVLEGMPSMAALAPTSLQQSVPMAMPTPGRAMTPMASQPSLPGVVPVQVQAAVTPPPDLRHSQSAGAGVDHTGSAAGVSLTQSAWTRRPPIGGVIAVALTVVVGSAAAGAYLVWGRASATAPTAPTALVETHPVVTAATAAITAPIVDPAPATERVVRLAVAPAGATVEIDDHAVTTDGGSVEVRGALGSVHAVTLRKDGRVTRGSVVIAETGPVPPRLELEAAPGGATRPPVTGPIAPRPTATATATVPPKPPKKNDTGVSRQFDQ